MPPPKRSAEHRTAAAVADDLNQARWLGGLSQADEVALQATMDWLSFSGEVGDDLAIRARDFLLHYLQRVAELHADSGDPTVRAASDSLVRLLTRDGSHKQLANTVRREALRTQDHQVSTDAVRKAEDRLIMVTAELAAADLRRPRDKPRTVEAATLHLLPAVIDLRQDLFNLMVVTYRGIPPSNRRERAVIERFDQRCIALMGRISVQAERLFVVGCQTVQDQSFEFALVGLAKHAMDVLFDEHDDRAYIRGFMPTCEGLNPEETGTLLQRSAGGKQVYERALEWIRSCYPDCAFERTFDVNYMCSPHQLLTYLFDFEASCAKVGYSALREAENDPIRFGRPRNILD